MPQQSHTRRRDRRTCPPCPECQSRNTRKVALLYEAGTRQTTTRGHYVHMGLRQDTCKNLQDSPLSLAVSSFA